MPIFVVPVHAVIYLHFGRLWAMVKQWVTQRISEVVLAASISEDSRSFALNLARDGTCTPNPYQRRGTASLPDNESIVLRCFRVVSNVMRA